MRAKISPVQPNTPAQTLVRANFGANAKVWSGLLTADQRSAWGFFAAANPLVNVFGASIIISGLAMLMRLNQILAQIGAALITDPPPDMSVPDLAAVTGASAESGAQTVEFQTDVQATQAGAKYYVFATGNLSPGATPQKNQYRFLAAYPSTTTLLQVDVSAAWLAKFGAVQAGASIGFRIGTVNVATGALTPGIVVNIIAS